jgi:hypothetical protein
MFVHCLKDLRKCTRSYTCLKLSLLHLIKTVNTWLKLLMHLFHSKELLKLYIKLYYRFVISCLVLEIFRPKLMSRVRHLGPILDLISCWGTVPATIGFGWNCSPPWIVAKWKFPLIYIRSTTCINFHYFNGLKVFVSV